MNDIEKERPEYKHKRLMWHTYRDLYAGGHQFKINAADYLLRRQKEPLDIYGERLQRVFYQNYIGSILDWYTATLFRREPSLQTTGGVPSGREFLSGFADDVDLRGTTLAEFLRGCFVDALVAGSSHILIDFPKKTEELQTRAEEDQVGQSRAFLVRYQAEELINWSRNERGDYDWVVLRYSVRNQSDLYGDIGAEETYWRYYDRTEYRIYRKTIRQGFYNAPIELIASGTHGLARQQRVPLVDLTLGDGLWLMNKAAQLQLEHFNKANALSWAITMGLFAMPVIYSDREWNQIVGESYFIQLGPKDKFGWTEPDGKVFQIAADNLEALKQEIYRVCYLSQASGELISGHAQSAESKLLDFTITEDILRALGALVKDFTRRVVEAIVDAREDGMAVSVAGLDELNITDFSTELQQAASLLQMNIQSPTLQKEIHQRLVMKYLSDARQDVKDQIAREIETSHLH